MAKDDLTLVRVLSIGDHGPDVVAVKRMMSRAGVGYPKQVREHGKFNDGFGDRLHAAVVRFQKKHHLVEDGHVGYMTFKPLVRFADSYDSKVLTDVAKQHIGDWGVIGRNSAFNGIDMGVDFKGAGPIPMFADGEIVRVVRRHSGWPGDIGGLIVVQCDEGPMARFPVYAAEDITIPPSHAVGKRLEKGALLAKANGTDWTGIELGWAGPAPNFIGTLFQARHGHYSKVPRATAEGIDFWKTLCAWMAKGG